MLDIKFDWDDISIVPKILSDIDSRSEINPYSIGGNLPLFTAPMDTVIDDKNYHHFLNNKINICFPRHIKYGVIKNDNCFYSYGLDEIISIIDGGGELPRKILIDVANGHMKKLYDVSKKIKGKWGNEKELMVGNIAHPETYSIYSQIGVDYIRVGIGGGSSCTTSANVGVHYPMASLIRECSYYRDSPNRGTKIVADGGFRNFSDIIKALALGADYVMLGGIFNKSIESCGHNFFKDRSGGYYRVDSDMASRGFKLGIPLYKYYRGMSTKEVQKFWNKGELKTSEGISKYNKVEYTLRSWTENFTDYLKSTMSYTGARNLEEFIGRVNFVQITQNSLMRFNK